MLFNVLIASLIPFVVWVIQKITGNTGPKATYLRRRIFAFGMLFIFVISVFGAIFLYQSLQGDPEIISSLSRYLGKRFAFWGLVFWIGLSNKPNEDKGFFYSIWQSHSNHNTIIKRNGSSRS